MTQDSPEAQITTVVDATPVMVAIDPDLDDPSLHRFIEDVAQAIHSTNTIARRYGFETEQAMVEFIKRNREVRRRIKVRRALWESDENTDGRIRKYAQHSVLEAMPTTAGMMSDPTVPHAVRLDALKAHARMAGVDGSGVAGRDGGAQGAGGNQFVVNFQFSNGKVQQISTTVGDQAATVDVAAEDAP